MDFSLLGFRGLQQAYNVHPAFVHFPIALFPSALLLYALGVMLKRRSWCVAGRACLYLAVAGTAVTILTGLLAQDSFPHDDRIHHLMQTHRVLGLLIGLISLFLFGWSFVQREQQPKASWAFLALLAGMTYLVLQNADLGGRMVFVEGAGVKATADRFLPAHHHEVEDEATSHHRHEH